MPTNSCIFIQYKITFLSIQVKVKFSSFEFHGPSTAYDYSQRDPMAICDYDGH